jgi:hypothetical protein
MLRHSIMFLVGLSVTLMIGCGPSKGEVTGKVTYQGNPLKEGTVQLQALDGTLHSGAVTDGSYKIPGVPIGKALITVAVNDQSAVDLNKKLAAGVRDGKGPSQADLKALEKAKIIPDKYNDFKTSGLTVDVKSPKTEHDIKLD